MSVPPVTGLRVVLSDCADAAREAEFNAWYDGYAVDILWPRQLINVQRYRNPDRRGDASHPRYLALYDIVTPDPALAWPETRDHPTRPRREKSELLDTVLAATYKIQHATGPARAAVTGVLALFTDCADEVQTHAARDWREAILRQVMAGGDFLRASLSANVEGAPAQPQYLHVFETTRPDPVRACRSVLARIDAGGPLAPPACVGVRYCDAYGLVFAAGD